MKISSLNIKRRSSGERSRLSHTTSRIRCLNAFFRDDSDNELGAGEVISVPGPVFWISTDILKWRSKYQWSQRVMFHGWHAIQVDLYQPNGNPKCGPHKHERYLAYFNIAILAKSGPFHWTVKSELKRKGMVTWTILKKVVESWPQSKCAVDTVFHVFISVIDRYKPNLDDRIESECGAYQNHEHEVI